VLSAYLPIVVSILFAVLVAAGALIVSAIFGPRRKTTNVTPYECGITPVGDARIRIDVKFYLVALLFVLFDLETVFLIAWGIVFRDFVNAGHGLYIFVIMAIFLGLLILGLLYEWGKGALEWGE
jgi:NADH-quinone oxidoreductase subunit A